MMAAPAIAAPTTIREHIRAISAEVGRSDLLPDRGAELLMEATALMGNVSDEIRAADADYALVLLTCLDANEAANRAKLRAETSPAYQRKREAHDTNNLLVEIIRSLKVVLRMKTEEMRMTR